MPAAFCPNCRGTNLATDYTSGRVECQECGYIAEENILVSEVGFAEGAGGRVHVQGAFVSHGSTGIGGLRGRNSVQSTENIKAQGQIRISLVAGHMALGHAVRQGAQRLFALAVDSNFHKGRRKDYVVASCLYLQSRLRKEPHMLIDFSERLQINVFELGGTYLKLRSILHLTDPMPMTDPAVYSLRFANRLDLGNDRHKVATDASRLVKRFQADWMSEGRRPAGVCGACLLVAARMNGHHRTPEEIAQIVKVSPTTIKRRLLEFAQTGMADKTVEQWKNMTDDDLKAPGEMQPPVVKQQELRDAKRRKFNDGITKLSKSSTSRSRSLSTRRSPSEAVPTQEEQEEEARKEEERTRQSQLKQSQMQTAIEAAVAQLDGLEEEEEEETDLAPPAPDQYVRDLDAAGDNPEIAQNERLKAIKKFKRYNKVASTGDDDLDLDEEELDELVEGEGEKEDDDEGEEDEEGEDDQDKEEKGADDVEDPRLRVVKFENFDDPEAVRKQIEEKYMPKVRHESALTDKHMEDRLSLWLGARDPLDVMYEFEVVNRALRARDKGAKADPVTEFDDVDDEEIDGIWKMEENEQRTRARMWLSHNGKWLEDSKEKQWQREQYELNNADKIQRRKQKRKQRPQKRSQPYNTPREAMEGLMTQKNFSSRLNLAAMKELGLDPGDGPGGGFDGLQVMDEKDDDENEKEDDNEKYDERGGYDYGGAAYELGGEVGADYAEYDE